MNLGEILVANGASFLLLIILVICRHMTRRNRRAVDHVFSCIIVIGFVGTFCETFTFLVDGRGNEFVRIINILANTLEYCCTATASVLWVWYVDLNLYRDEKRLKKTYLPMEIIWAVLIILLIGNLFGGYLFSVDANNVYTRQPLGYIFYVFLVGSYLTSIVMYYRFRSLHGRTLFFPIWMFLAPLFISIIIQIPFYGISVTFLGCSIGLVGIYMNLQSNMSLVDSLTGLYNRAYIEHAMITARENKRYVFSGIMLDIDRFKQINDTYGHSVGDNALTDAASILVKATDRDSVAFRYAGDEFIILVRTPLGNSKDLEAKTIAVEKAVLTESERFNSESKAPYKIVFSMGHAMYDTSLGDDDFFRSIDAEMYKDKERHKRTKERE